MKKELICKILHGSHLYGTNTPTSDTDFKSIFLPSIDDVLLCNVVHAINDSTGNCMTKNGKDDIDNGEFSIHKFVQLLTVGDIMAFDILYAPDENIIERGANYHIFEKIRENHHIFTSKNISGYIGYIRKQTAKYSAKGSRLAVVREVISILEELVETDKQYPIRRIEDIIDKLPVTDFSFRDEKGYNVIGKCFQNRDYLHNMLLVLQKYFSEYGSRALQAERNEGVDFKAVHHAVRACYQLISLYSSGKMELPLPEPQRSIAIAIKKGELHYKNEIEPMIEQLHLEVERLAKESCHPQTVDKDKINQLLLEILKETYFGKK